MDDKKFSVLIPFSHQTRGKWDSLFRSISRVGCSSHRKHSAPTGVLTRDDVWTRLLFYFLFFTSLHVDWKTEFFLNYDKNQSLFLPFLNVYKPRPSVSSGKQLGGGSKSEPKALSQGKMEGSKFTSLK